jgi:hypothetical protein
MEDVVCWAARLSAGTPTFGPPVIFNVERQLSSARSAKRKAAMGPGNDHPSDKPGVGYATYKRHPGLGGSNVAHRPPRNSKCSTVDGQ